MRERIAGFSLIEVIIVLVILGLLASLVAPRYRNHLDKSKYQTSQLQLKEVGKALEAYYMDHGKYPSIQNWDELASEHSPLQEYLSEIPKGDAWGRAYLGRSTETQYEFTGQSIPNPKLADRYPEYTCRPGPVIEQRNQMVPAAPQ